MLVVILAGQKIWFHLENRAEIESATTKRHLVRSPGGGDGHMVLDQLVEEVESSDARSLIPDTSTSS